PMLGGILEHGAVLHIGLFLLVIPVAAIAMFEGWQRHRLLGPALFAATGCALLLAAIMTHGDEVTETALTVAGSLCLITGHVVNWSRSVASGNR
ncbi:MAG: MerC domain-containing protein, partial [Pseudomonadota bacterium]